MSEQTPLPGPSTVALSATSPPMPTFAAVHAAALAAPDIPEGSRKNMLAAIDTVARLMGAAGLQATIDIPKIQARFEKVTPAMLGFATAGALSGLKSNLRRALKIAGVETMSGASRAPLTSAWEALRQQAIKHAGLWPALSRFAHRCSARGVGPGEVGPAHLAEHLCETAATCIKSRAEKAERQITRAWTRAQALVPGWPTQALPIPVRRRSEEAAPWSTYPATLEADARAFVERDRGHWLRGGKPALRPRTIANYLDALLRAAAELVASGVPPQELRSLADLVSPDRVEIILTRVAERTGREKGGHVGLLAIVLLMAARDHVRVSSAELAILARFEKQVRARREMGDRTFRRLNTLTDAQITALTRLPARLTALARRRGTVDETSARLVRAALFLQLLLDTAARQGNIVALDLDRDVLADREDRISIAIAGELVKNGEDINCDLPAETARLFRLYCEAYRPLHLGGASTTWLFPRPDGSHWSTTRANAVLQDFTAKFIGVPVNPHLVRAICGIILEDEHPGAIGAVRDILGHRLTATTETFYARRNATRSRRLHHRALAARRSGAKGEPPR